MGSKGSQTVQNTNQTQTYTPNPQAAGYITNALGRAADVANSPFNIPQAPVAGFSPDQLGAFQQFRNLQGAAQPYYNTASNYFSPQGIQDFYNPYAQNVMAGLKDIFGAQNTQNTANLTQAAGGVGADRIAVGQAEMARQQGLAAGQTLANLWQNAGQQAMSAGQGQMALGANVQNSQLQGANALLGTGGLQQQLQQAQLNAPYQQQLAAAAFPYQQSQFLASITGALAPGLGGTTQGYGTNVTTPPQPSIWSQLLGAGMAGVGAYNAFGGSGSGSGGWNPFGSYDAWGGGNRWDGSAYGGSASNPLPGLTASDYAADGGVVHENPYAVSMAGGGVPTDPIDVSQLPIVPATQLQPMQMHVPQLDLSPKQTQQQSGGGGFGDILGAVAKIAPFFLKDGGSVGYAEGGAPDDDTIYRMPDWKNGVNPYDTWRAETPVQADTPSDDRMSFADPTSSPAPAVAAIDAAAKVNPYRVPARAPVAADASDEGVPPIKSQSVSPYSQGPAAAPARDGFDSPWMSLVAAGLGIMGGTSPYAGVNIGTGAMQGLKTLQTQRENRQKDEGLDLQARRLEQEAQHHLDSYGIQKEQLAISKANAEKEKFAPAGNLIREDGSIVPIGFNINTGQYVGPDGNPVSLGKGDRVVSNKKTPIDEGEARAVAEYFVRTGDQSRINSLGLTSEARQAVQAQVRHVQKELGITDEELATKRVEFEGRKAGQRTLGVMEARMGSAAIEAEGAIKLARGNIEKLPRTAFLPWNELMQLKDKKVLNPDQAELFTRVQAIVNTYSAVMSRGANITTDASRHHAAELLNTAYDPATFNRVIDTMLQEIEMAKNSPMKMREFYRKMYGNPGDASKEKGSKLTPEQQQALDWANANPTDARAAEIKKRLGVQ